MNNNCLNTIEEIANANLKERFSIGQDFINNQLIYGIKFGTNSYILTSNKNFIALKDVENTLGIIPKNETVEISKLKSSTIQNFVSGTENIFLSPQNLFNKINNYIRKYIFFQDEKTYTVLTLWIFTTYCYKIFSYIPYLHLRGDKGAGKSTLLTILKNLCFNAIMWYNITEYVIFRYIDISNATLLLDEAENLKNPKTQGINCILNGGFNKEGIVARTSCTKYSEKVIQYSTYSMKALAGINDIPNVLKDRCLNIKMSKKPKSLQLQKYLDISMDLKNETDIIVQNLYIFCLQHCSEIFNIYEKMDVNLPATLSARDTDILLPLFSIAKVIDSSDNKIQNTLFEYSKEMSTVRNELDIEENKSYKLIVDLYSLLHDNIVSPYNSNCYLSNDVLKYLRTNCDNYFYPTTTALTKDLKSLDIKTTRYKVNNSKKTYYQILPEQINKLLDSYNITIPSNTVENNNF